MTLCKSTLNLDAFQSRDLTVHVIVAYVAYGEITSIETLINSSSTISFPEFDQKGLESEINETTREKQKRSSHLS